MPRSISLLAAAACLGGALGGLTYLAVSDAPAWRSEASPVPAIPTVRERRSAVKAQADEGVAYLAAHPLLQPANASDVVTLQLTGIVPRPFPRALVAIGTKPPRWLSLGQSAEGVELVELAGDTAVVDTPSGVRTLKLGAPPDTGGKLGSVISVGVEKPQPR